MTKLSKILNLNQLKYKIKNIKKISLVHGVFDVLHIGHKRHFDVAKSYSDFLVVSITSDEYVRKGPNRPVFNHFHRAEMLASFESIDAVIINYDVTSIELINNIKPSFYFKGNDYKNLDGDITNNIKAEISAVKKIGGDIIFTNDIQFSSSKVINQNFIPLNFGNLKITKKADFFKNECFDALNKIKNLKVAVIGEMIFDKYIKCSELEKPSKEMIQAVEVRDYKIYPGGSFAIARNIAEFSSNVDLFIAGKFSRSDINFLKKSNLKNINLNIFKDEYNSITKSRFLNDSGRKLFEIYERSGKKRDFSSTRFQSILKKKLSKYDLVILADFGHGFLNDDLIDIIQKNSRFLSINAQTNADNRGFNLITKYKTCDSVIIDQPELRLAMIDKRGSVESLSKKLLNKIKVSNLMTTMGKDGIHLSIKKNKNKYLFFNLPAFENSPVDTMGAGDAVFGIASLLFKIKADPKVTIFLSNIFGALATKIIGHESYIKRIEVEKSIQYLLK